MFRPGRHLEAQAARQPTGVHKPVPERQRAPVGKADAAWLAEHELAKSQRREMAQKLGAFSRTPPNRVVGWG